MKIKIFILLFIFLSVFSNAKELKKIKLKLSWFNQFQFAGYYIAKEKGYYKDLGLDVEIIDFDFGSDIPQEVSDKKIDFAVGRETLILEKSNGKDIVALYALFQASPLILLSTEKSNISTIDDFKNQRIMTTIDDASEVSLKAMIRSNNVSFEDLNFIKHTHDINDLIDGHTDVISAYISKTPFILNQKGIDYNIFDPKSFGFDMYSDLLYTNEWLIKNDLDSVLAFKEASLKGWSYAYENIEETASLIYNKYNNQKLKLDELIFEATELKKLSYFNTSKLGEIKKDKLQRIFDLYNIMGLTDKTINLDDFVFEHRRIKDTRLNEHELNYLKNKKTIKMCVIPNGMPYSDISNNKLVGLAADYVELLEENIHRKIILYPTLSWAESLKSIQENKCDILPMASINESRKKYLSFTSSYFNIRPVIITKNNIPFIDNLSELKKVKIGITRGYSLLEELRRKYPSIEFVETNNLKEGFDKVYENELLGQISSLGAAWYLLQNDYLSKLKITGKLEEKIALRVAINKEDVLLTSIFNKAVSSVSISDKQRIKNKWLHIESQKEFDSKLLLQMAAFVMFVLMFLLYRQRLLNKVNISLNKIVDEKTEELKKINSTLENRINKEVEENLQKDRILTQQSKMASMGQMIENIAHQWRQPLSVISTGASGLKIKKQLNDLDDELFMNTLDSIINSSKYLSHTIDDFRFFFKPNKEKSEFSISITLDKTINLLSSKFDTENIIIIRDFEDLKINGHETEFIQVFINILNNAKDALVTSSGKKKFIFVKITRKKDKTIIKIRDNAGGIDDNIINKIFEPYFTTKHMSKGTGIGLYMCEQIINKYMNGVIDVKNKEYSYDGVSYKGAQFSIVLYDK